MIQNTQAWSLENDRFTIAIEQRFETYFFKDLIMCKGSDNSTELYIKDCEPILVSQTLKVWEDALSPENFWRVQKSYIVNRSHLQKFHQANGGMAVLSQDCIAYVSSENRERVINAFRANMVSKARD